MLRGLFRSMAAPKVSLEYGMGIKLFPEELSLSIQQLVENDIEFSCAICGNGTKRYQMVPRPRQNEEWMIVLHKVCDVCMVPEPGGVG